MKKIEIVRDKKDNVYLMIKLSLSELSELEKDIEGHQILMEKYGKKHES